MRLFGITGDFLAKRATHDEVDAVTSAVVGLFFWGGKFEALGNETEDYLIIPDLHRQVHGWSNRRVVGISGPISAGKTTAAEYLERKGYVYGRYSLVLREMLDQRGRSVDRAALQELGDSVHRRPGQRWLNQQLLARLPSGMDFVIDGLRWLEDHAFWIERFGPAFVHLHIAADYNARRQRYVASGGRAAEFDEAANHDVEQSVPVLASVANQVIRNDRSIAGFTRKVAAAIKRHFSEGEASCRSRL